MPLSNVTALEILNGYFGGVAITVPTGYDIALFTTMPNQAGSGGVEAAYSGYARTTVANNDANWEAAIISGDVAEAKNSLQFNLPTPTANGTDLVGAAIYKQGTSTMVARGTFATPKPVVTGVEITIPIGFFKQRLSPVT